ncbi:MAG: hypothetical protein HY331_17370 [Chloroflexi bacterium]|nr:hypothetical protein [Chloroflexota bacterium]
MFATPRVRSYAAGLRGWRAIPVLILVVALALSGIVHVLASPLAFFQVDGDPDPGSNAATVLADVDWETVLDPDGPGGATVDGGALGVTGVLVKDPHSKKTTDSSVFQPAGKFGQPDKWSIQAANVGAAQNELTNLGIIFLPDAPATGNTPAGHFWVGVTGERTKKEGTFVLYVELNQKQWDPFSTDPNVPKTVNRQDGDVVLAFQLKGNPEDAQRDLDVVVLVYKPNDATCSAFAEVFGGGFCTVFRGNGSILTGQTSLGEATMNATGFPAAPWGSLDPNGNTRTTVPAFNWFEGFIDLTAANIEPQCPGFSSVAFYAGSSISIDSDLKDLGGPVRTNISCRLFGHKYEDTNANGVIDSPQDTDSPIEGWTIKLTRTHDASGTPVTETPITTTTDANGFYEFNGIQSGTYKVEEDCTGQTGFVQSVPAPTNGCGSGIYQNIVVNAANNDQGPFDFANYQLVTISGVKFKDINSDGSQDPDGADNTANTVDDEGGLSGWEIHLFGTNVNGTQVHSHTTTVNDGSYSFADLKPGNYTVCETQQSGWKQTAPTSGADCTGHTGGGGGTASGTGHSISSSSFGTVGGQDFGNTPLSTITVTFTPQTSPAATKATQIVCKDKDNNTVGSVTNSNTLTVENRELKESTITCAVTYVDP